MEDLIKSIKATLYDRATSPLFGTFAISWALWNHRLIFTLFSSMPAQEKFPYIDNYLYYDLHTKFGFLIIYPLLTTIIFIFAYPYPAKFVYGFWRKRQKELKEIKQKIEDETPLTREESREIRRQLFELEAEYEKEIQKLENQIEQLKKEAEEKRNTIPTIKRSAKKATTKKSEPEITKEQIELLEFVETSSSPEEQEIIVGMQTSKRQTLFNLGELENKGLIESNINMEGKFYEITHKGRAILVKKSTRPFTR